jgi:6-phosphofructokinase 1
MVIGIQGNKITRTPLSECLEKTWAVAEAMNKGDSRRALSLRGSGFEHTYETLSTLVRVFPTEPLAGRRRLRIAVMHGGGPAPGMNTAIRAAVRLGIDKGHIMLGVQNGFRGLIDGDVRELHWMDVAGWASRGGAELGTNRYIPELPDLYKIARTIEEQKLEGLLLVGGWAGYQAVLTLFENSRNYPAFNIPILCLPASINNNLPGTELSVGADTALNSIVQTVDQIKQSAVASRRVFIVEVMGHFCGYLTLMGGMATGAEHVYMHEYGVTLRDLVRDVEDLIAGFKRGKRLGLIIRNEMANEVYNTGFMAKLFEEEGGNLFDVRQAILGHMQQGGDPSPFDRILATRFADKCIDYLEEQAAADEFVSACIGQLGGKIMFTDLRDLPRLMDNEHARPRKQWWLRLADIADVMAQSGPGEAIPSAEPV